MSNSEPPLDALSSPESGEQELSLVLPDEPPETPPTGIPTDKPKALEFLPEVEPPSAGFIVQLFLIPMLIVGAIVGVYALFGRLASGEQDWRTLVTELRSSNEHRRWRAAEGLAHLLQSDEKRGEDGQQLARNPEIAKALLEVLAEESQSKKSPEKALNQQQYLVTALGMLDQPQTVIPALQKLMTAKTEQEFGVRLESLRSIMLIANRTAERAKQENRPLLLEELVEIPELVEDVIAVSHEPKELFRQVGAFTLGFLPCAESRDRLEVLLSDSDRAVQVNAALGLARQNSTLGWPVLLESLKKAKDTSETQTGMDLVILQNALKAVERLDAKWTKAQKQELIALVQFISKTHKENRIRIDALKTLNILNDQP